MGKYGITSEAQLIDIATIKSGCEAYISALDFFEEGGNQVKVAGSVCNSRALSVDGASFESQITQIGNDFSNLKGEYAGKASAVYSAAVGVYNEQVAELNEYRRMLAAQAAEREKKKQEQSSSSTS